VFWIFLAQVLGPARSCREALRAAQVWLALAVSASTSAYCQARARLPLEFLEKTFRRLARALRQRADGLWMNRCVLVLDGTTLSMPDTPANQALYPQPSAQRKGCGFPIMRLTAIFSLATGAVLAVARGSLADHERLLWHKLWGVVKKGNVVLADRGFCGFAEYCVLVRRGVDAVMRLHARRSTGAREIARLADGDSLVEWRRTGPCPKWMTKRQWRALPKVLRVRHIKVDVQIKGFRTRSLTVATTILDAQAYPACCIADLYRRRWMAELLLRDIKITMGMDILRCKTPDLIHKELLMHLIAYNLVRALMLQAAESRGVEPLRMSLCGAVATSRQWAPRLAAERSKAGRLKLLDNLYCCMAADIVPSRPDRVEPRARKRRPKNYQLLRMPRAEFQESRHRNHYAKALS